MTVHLVNPSDNSFGTAVITPRWLFVLAAATPQSMGDPILVDESLEQLNAATISHGTGVAGRWEHGPTSHGSATVAVADHLSRPASAASARSKPSSSIVSPFACKP
jgi:hypothetical protein